MDVTTDTAPRRTSFATLADFMKQLTDVQMESYRAAIKERLGFDPLRNPDRGIGIAEATRLAGVLTGTGTQWVRRTKTGKGLAKPFPTKRPDSPAGKPLYNPFDVAAWLDWTRRWPPGTAARPETRQLAGDQDSV